MKKRRLKVVWLCGVLLASVGLMMLSTSCLVNKVVFHPTKGMQASLGDYSAVQPIGITAEDGVRISAFYLEDTPASPTILFFHGNAGNASHRLDDADRLRSLGANVLLVDYRGYGLSEGRPTEPGVYRDAEAALEYLIEGRHARMGDIVLYGRSLGSAVAVHLAQDRAFAGMVLVSPFTSGRDMAPVLAKPFAGKRFDTYGKVGRLRCPLLVIHGDRDSLVPLEMGKRLFERAGVDKQLVVIEGGGHNDLIAVNRGRFFSSIKTFLERVRR
jgi:pimeloyl-ACP methyl ester carboxylesterase